MFGLWTRSPRPRKTVAPRTVKLFLERLEDRLSPTTTSGYMPPPSSPSNLFHMENLNLQFTYEANKHVLVTGGVSNTPTPGGQTILFTGAAGGQATTDANGSFSVVLTATSLGEVSATSATEACRVVTFDLVSQAPVITNFQAVNLGNGVWAFTGKVTGAPNQAEVVNFGGIGPLNGMSVEVGSDGTFSFYAIVGVGQGGIASAQAVDWWGDASQGVQTSVCC